MRKNDGTRKDTRAIDSNEFFVKQPTPYIYPLLKAHKLNLAELKQVKVGRNHQIEKTLKTSCDGTYYIGRAYRTEISSIQINLRNVEAFLMPLIWSVNCTPEPRETPNVSWKTTGTETYIIIHMVLCQEIQAHITHIDTKQ